MDAPQNFSTRSKTPARPSRRQLLAGAVGAVGAIAANAVVESAPVRAADGDPMLIGAYNSGTHETILDSSTSAGSLAMLISNLGAGGGLQVNAPADGEVAIEASAVGAGGIGVFGYVRDGTAVFGTSETGTGVYGENTQTTGFGIHGKTGGNGSAVFGEATSPGAGVGVFGESAAGTGVLARSASGFALVVGGLAQFSRSGVATVNGTTTNPKSSVKVNVAPLSTTSVMLATLQSHVGGVYVVAAVPNVAGGYFTIYLNKAVTSAAGPIAWMVVERP
jgi:hypothetical protein